MQNRPPCPGLAHACIGLGLVVVAACTVTPARDTPDRTLVTEDAPVYDKRFRGIAPEDLDLEDFWVDGQAGDRLPVALTNRTVADLVSRVSDGIVNLYTRVLQERKAVFGVAPNDLLPIRIPIVSSVLDIVPWKVPVPFQTHGISLGSGFVINQHGYVLTNAHVVHNATDIRVVRAGVREEYLARIIGVDPLTDTALLRIEQSHSLTVLRLGDSDALDVGEMVVAVGNPLGLNHTVTSGLVSAKERIVPGASDGQLLDFLQTDSAINPGSSGGPLLNIHGEVVGINTAIAAGADAIGFAIPINIVKDIMPLLVTGKHERGWFGATARPFDPGEAGAMGYPNPNGVIFDEVVPGSPAEAAGVRSGDIVQGVDGVEIRDFVVFRRLLLPLVPGDTMTLTLVREGSSFEVSSQLTAQP